MTAPLRFSRVFAMPSSATFSIAPIANFVNAYLAPAQVSVDPFARNSRLATHTNDIDPTTTADEHMDAAAFCSLLAERGVRADLGIFDPPYSPRQISECYRGAGLSVGMVETQNGALYRRVRDALDKIIRPGGIVLSFGWNSVGMGIGRAYELIDMLVVVHGGAHNDTICIAERKAGRDTVTPRDTGWGDG